MAQRFISIWDRFPPLSDQPVTALTDLQNPVGGINVPVQTRTGLIPRFGNSVEETVDQLGSQRTDWPMTDHPILMPGSTSRVSGLSDIARRADLMTSVLNTSTDMGGWGSPPRASESLGNVNSNIAIGRSRSGKSLLPAPLVAPVGSNSGEFNNSMDSNREDSNILSMGVSPFGPSPVLKIPANSFLNRSLVGGGSSINTSESGLLPINLTRKASGLLGPAPSLHAAAGGRPGFGGRVERSLPSARNSLLGAAPISGPDPAHFNPGYPIAEDHVIPANEPIVVTSNTCRPFSENPIATVPEETSKLSFSWNDDDSSKLDSDKVVDVDRRNLDEKGTILNRSDSNLIKTEKSKDSSEREVSRPFRKESERRPPAFSKDYDRHSSKSSYFRGGVLSGLPSTTLSSASRRHESSHADRRDGQKYRHRSRSPSSKHSRHSSKDRRSHRSRSRSNSRNRDRLARSRHISNQRDRNYSKDQSHRRKSATLNSGDGHRADSGRATFHNQDRAGRRSSDIRQLNSERRPSFRSKSPVDNRDNDQDSDSLILLNSASDRSSPVSIGPIVGDDQEQSPAGNAGILLTEISKTSPENRISSATTKSSQIAGGKFRVPSLDPHHASSMTNVTITTMASKSKAASADGITSNAQSYMSLENVGDSTSISEKLPANLSEKKFEEFDLWGVPSPPRETSESSKQFGEVGDRDQKLVVPFLIEKEAVCPVYSFPDSSADSDVICLDEFDGLSLIGTSDAKAAVMAMKLELPAGSKIPPDHYSMILLPVREEIEDVSDAFVTIIEPGDSASKSANEISSTPGSVAGTARKPLTRWSKPVSGAENCDFNWSNRGSQSSKPKEIVSDISQKPSVATKANSWKKDPSSLDSNLDPGGAKQDGKGAASDSSKERLSKPMGSFDESKKKFQSSKPPILSNSSTEIIHKLPVVNLVPKKRFGLLGLAPEDSITARPMGDVPSISGVMDPPHLIASRVGAELLAISMPTNFDQGSVQSASFTPAEFPINREGFGETGMVSIKPRISLLDKPRVEPSNPDANVFSVGNGMKEVENQTSGRYGLLESPEKSSLFGSLDSGIGSRSGLLGDGPPRPAVTRRLPVIEDPATPIVIPNFPPPLISNLASETAAQFGRQNRSDAIPGFAEKSIDKSFDNSASQNRVMNSDITFLGYHQSNSSKLSEILASGSGEGNCKDGIRYPGGDGTESIGGTRIRNHGSATQVPTTLPNKLNEFAWGKSATVEQQSGKLTTPVTTLPSVNPRWASDEKLATVLETFSDVLKKYSQKKLAAAQQTENVVGRGFVPNQMDESTSISAMSRSDCIRSFPAEPKFNVPNIDEGSERNFWASATLVQPSNQQFDSNVASTAGYSSRVGNDTARLPKHGNVASTEFFNKTLGSEVRKLPQQVPSLSNYIRSEKPGDSWLVRDRERVDQGGGRFLADETLENPTGTLLARLQSQFQSSGPPSTDTVEQGIESSEVNFSNMQDWDLHRQLEQIDSNNFRQRMSNDSSQTRNYSETDPKFTDLGASGPAGGIYRSPEMSSSSTHLRRGEPPERRRNFDMDKDLNVKKFLKGSNTGLNFDSDSLQETIDAFSKQSNPDERSFETQARPGINREASMDRKNSGDRSYRTNSRTFQDQSDRSGDQYSHRRGRSPGPVLPSRESKEDSGRNYSGNPFDASSDASSHIRSSNSDRNRDRSPTHRSRNRSPSNDARISRIIDKLGERHDDRSAPLWNNRDIDSRKKPALLPGRGSGNAIDWGRGESMLNRELDHPLRQDDRFGSQRNRNQAEFPKTSSSFSSPKSDSRNIVSAYRSDRKRNLSPSPPPPPPKAFRLQTSVADFQSSNPAIIRSSFPPSSSSSFPTAQQMPPPHHNQPPAGVFQRSPFIDSSNEASSEALMFDSSPFLSSSTPSNVFQNVQPSHQWPSSSEQTSFSTSFNPIMTMPSSVRSGGPGESFAISTTNFSQTALPPGMAAAIRQSVAGLEDDTVVEVAELKGIFNSLLSEPNSILNRDPKKRAKVLKVLPLLDLWDTSEDSDDTVLVSLLQFAKDLVEQSR